MKANTTMKRIAALIYISFVCLTGFSVNAQQLSTPVTIPDQKGTWGDIVYGDPAARVELIEYGSLTCPHCASFSADVLPRLMEDYVNDGKLRFVFRNFVRDRYDLAAAVASRCMLSEDASKRTLENLFAEQASWLQSQNPFAAISEIAGREGLSQEDFSACLSEQNVRNHIVEMTQNGVKLYDIKAIPTLVLNGQPFNYQNYTALKARIDAAISQLSE